MKVIQSVSLASVVLASVAAMPCSAATLMVGPGKTYTTICDAIYSSKSGDIIEVTGNVTYTRDVCRITQDNLIIRGVGNGRAVIDAGGASADNKGIFAVYGNQLTVENIEFKNATSTSNNGAGIRFQGSTLLVRNCFFHDNQNGILASDSDTSHIVVERSEFGYNGYGDGLTHNLYINHVASFTFRYNYSHHAKVGHLVKSRAAVNFILHNRLSTELADSSYELDLPNGGLSFVIGNIIQQGLNSQQNGMMSYMVEGPDPRNPSTALFVVNNTFANEAYSGTFVKVANGVATPAIIRNNIFSGPGTVTTQPNAVLAGNFIGHPGFVNAQGYDYRLVSTSPAINTGVPPGDGAGYSLRPQTNYVHSACTETRAINGVIDVGALEYGAKGISSSCPAGPLSEGTLAIVRLSPTSVIGGTAASGTILFSGPAPIGGAVVRLASSKPLVAVVPSQVTVPGGATSVVFPVPTVPVTGTWTVTIAAAYSGVTRTALLTVVEPGSSTPPTSPSPTSPQPGPTSPAPSPTSPAPAPPHPAPHPPKPPRR